MVRAYIAVAHLLAQESIDAESEDKRAKTAAAIQIAVSSVEAYFNVFARLWIDQNPNFKHSEQIASDLRTKKFLGGKLKEWPQLFFGKPIDFGRGIGQDFLGLVDRRNRLMHFTSESHEFEFENVKIKGLIDTSVYDTLVPDDAKNAVITAEGFIKHLLQLQGLSPPHVQIALQHWTGRSSQNAT